MSVVPLLGNEYSAGGRVLFRAHARVAPLTSIEGVRELQRQKQAPDPLEDELKIKQIPK